ncbi:MAG: fluoride efflux transporter CrcB [Candidatus Cryptobacteroides sp.]
MLRSTEVPNGPWSLTARTAVPPGTGTATAPSRTDMSYRRLNNSNLQSYRRKMVGEIIKNILIVGAGSFIGGVSRYLVSIVMKPASKGFPWGTLTVNLLGCFLIGLLWGFFCKNGNEANNWTLFLSVGLCGGFTTFSTFSKEALMMLQTGNTWAFLAYIATSLLAGIGLVALGYRSGS